jgi:thymidine phosphorylase
MVRAQGGDPDAPLPVARHTETVTAPATGYVRRLDARAVGLAAWRLGAGRGRQDDTVSAAAGVRWRAGLGDRVAAGQVVFELATDDPERIPSALAALDGALEMGPTPPAPRRLVLGQISS